MRIIEFTVSTFLLIVSAEHALSKTVPDTPTDRPHTPSSNGMPARTSAPPSPAQPPKNKRESSLNSHPDGGGTSPSRNANSSTNSTSLQRQRQNAADINKAAGN